MLIFDKKLNQAMIVKQKILILNIEKGRRFSYDTLVRPPAKIHMHYETYRNIK